MRERYLLPIAVLLETIKDVSELLSLRTQLSSIPDIAEEPCLAEIVMGTGRIHACTITSTTGQQLLWQQAAFSALEQLGELEWTIDSLPSFPSTPQPFGEGSQSQSGAIPSQQRYEAIPQRAGFFVTPALLEGLPRRQKHVLLLADGHKQASEIARLLGLHPQEVELLLSQLHHQHLIHYITGEPS